MVLVARVVSTLDVNQRSQPGSCGVEREGKVYILQVGVLGMPSRKRCSHRIVSTRRTYDGLKCEITLRVRVDFNQLLCDMRLQRRGPLRPWEDL